jgi:hypothetical protein
MLIVVETFLEYQFMLPVAKRWPCATSAAPCA